MVTTLRAKETTVKLEPFSTPVCRMAVILDPEGNALRVHQVTQSWQYGRGACCLAKGFTTIGHPYIACDQLLEPLRGEDDISDAHVELPAMRDIQNAVGTSKRRDRSPARHTDHLSGPVPALYAPIHHVPWPHEDKSSPQL